MLSYADILKTLPTLPRYAYQSHAYRVVDNKYLTGNLLPRAHRYLYGLGVPVAGARFTPRGGMPTIYIAEDLATAWDEVNPVSAIVRQHDPGLAGPTRPGGYASVVYDLATVIDMTEPGIQSALGTDRAELLAPWRQMQRRGRVSPTQQLGQAVYDSGLFQAIWYESVRAPGTFCLAVFPDRLTGAAFLEVYDPDGNIQERLP